VFPLVGAILLVASARGWLTGSLNGLSFNPWLILVGVLVMRSPLVVGLLPTVDRRLGLALAGLCAYTYAIEAVGLATGLPYGEFTYQVALGPQLAGVPLALPVLFLPLVLDAYVLTTRTLHPAAGRWARVLVAIALVVGMDLVLDPGAVGLGFWRYANPDVWGVPLINYAGWLVSGTVTVLAVEATIDRDELDERIQACPFLLDDLVSFVLLWGAINLQFGNLVPALAAVGLGVLVHRADGFDAGVWPGLG